MSPLLEVTDLAVTFRTDGDPVTAVRGISYRVEPGEVVAMVGESGSGKSAAAMAVVGLLPEYAQVRGSVRLQGTELLGLADNAMSRFRGKAIGTVFQDPMSALTPVYTVGDQIAEAIEVHQPRVGKKAARRRAVELLDLVGISQPQRRSRAFPHELSGGERQRVVIAIAIANDPDLLICDEPTTALDVTVQAQILDVLKAARDVTGAGVLIITHDLGVVAEFADRALVMYAGRVVESAGVNDLYRDRRMPYTVGLLGSVPRLDAAQGTRLVPIPGAPPSLAGLAPGCPFAPRCPLVIDECLTAEPELLDVATDHRAACIRTELVTGRSAADIYRVKTEARPAALGDASVVVRVRHLVKPTGWPRAWCCAGRSARSARSTASVSNSGRAARWVSSANPVRASRPPCTRSWSWLRRNRDRSKSSALTSPRWGQRNADRCAATSRWSSKTRWRP
ncbi:peptide ABC transporter/ATP-binding protein [Mycobacterium tuberculosis GM 1503]|nr:peptide ABC transporter/ATP-binding protein [Mycobacterium tuberculosis GM 1503]